MKKYAWQVWRSGLWGRDEYTVRFADASGYLEPWHRKALPKRRLINNLKVLMTCPVGFSGLALGLRASEDVFIIYDYNISKEK